MARRKSTAKPHETDALERIFQRHQELMRIYSAAQTTSSNHVKIRRDGNNTVSQHDLHVLQQNFQFIRDEEADAARGETDWQVRMSVRYYQKLFREYALADLSRYEEGKIGLRWRTEMEVVAGKGQFICGNKRCNQTRNLHSYELLFAYVEQEEKKRCLVKVRVCEECAKKLFYKKLLDVKKKEVKKRMKKRKHDKQHRQQEEEEAVEATVEGEDDMRTKGTKRKRDIVDNSTSEPANRIHEICARINASENEKFRSKSDHSNSRIGHPSTSKSRSENADQHECFDELLL